MCCEHSQHGRCQPVYLTKHVESNKTRIRRRPRRSQNDSCGFFLKKKGLVRTSLSGDCCNRSKTPLCAGGQSSGAVGWHRRGFGPGLVLGRAVSVAHAEVCWWF